MITYVNKNETINLYYQTDDLQPADVEFDIYDLDGLLLDTLLGDTVLDGKSLYTAEYTTPNEDTYILGVGREDDEENPVPFILAVGQPAKKFFYYTETPQNDVITYRIYDVDGVEHQSGDLIRITNNFYYADISSLQASEILIVETSDGTVEALQAETAETITILGTGTVSTNARVYIYPVASATGTGTVSVSPELEIPLNVSITGSGTTAVVNRIYVDCTANPSGVCTTSASATILIHVTTNCSGVGTCEAAPGIQYSLVASCSAVGLCNAFPRIVGREQPAPLVIDDSRNSLGVAYGIFPICRRKKKCVTGTLVAIKFTFHGETKEFFKYIETEVDVNIEELAIAMKRTASKISVRHLRTQAEESQPALLRTLKQEKQVKVVLKNTIIHHGKY